MSWAFLLDEHLRGPLWTVVQRHNLASELPLDVIRVGDVDELPLGISDADLLSWAERENRILSTEDRRTMPQHLENHLKSGHRSPGVFVVRTGFQWTEVLEILVLVAHAGESSDYADAVTFLP